MQGSLLKDLEIGMEVGVVQKHHQRSGELTYGLIKRILTKSAQHPHGIKVMLTDNVVGRVKEICD